MISFGTDHQSMSEFADALDEAAPGATFCYAIGDLAVSAPCSRELIGLRGLVSRVSDGGRGYLTQRRRSDLRFVRGGACFEYLFTKAAAR